MFLVVIIKLMIIILFLSHTEITDITEMKKTRVFFYVSLPFSYLCPQIPNMLGL